LLPDDSTNMFSTIVIVYLGDRRVRGEEFIKNAQLLMSALNCSQKKSCHCERSEALSAFPPLDSDAPRAQRGASRSLNLIIYELCRFIPAYKAGLSRHLPVKCELVKVSSRINK
jgi:hypothetical protein